MAGRRPHKGAVVVEQDCAARLFRPHLIGLNLVLVVAIDGDLLEALFAVGNAWCNR
jgi:hypothetical protein